MEECHDTTTLIRKFGGKNPHFLIDSKRVLCQTSHISMVMMAVSREVVALMQIGDDIADSLTVDVAEERDYDCL
jgi:hypothetical protein